MLFFEAEIQQFSSSCVVTRTGGGKPQDSPHSNCTSWSTSCSICCASLGPNWNVSLQCESPANFGWRLLHTVFISHLVSKSSTSQCWSGTFWKRYHSGSDDETSQSQNIHSIFERNQLEMAGLQMIFVKYYWIIKMAAKASTPWWGRSVVWHHPTWICHNHH